MTPGIKQVYKTVGYKRFSGRTINGASNLFSRLTWDEGWIKHLQRQLDGDDDVPRMPGIRQTHERAPSPKGVIRYRDLIIGTGQDEPCWSVWEAWVHVPPLKGRLP